MTVVLSYEFHVDARVASIVRKFKQKVFLTSSVFYYCVFDILYFVIYNLLNIFYASKPMQFLQFNFVIWNYREKAS